MASASIIYLKLRTICGIIKVVVWLKNEYIYRILKE